MSTLKTINIQNPASSTINIVTDASGNIGIGTSSPSRRLDIEQLSTDYQLRIGDTGGNYYDIGRNTTTGLLTFNGNQAVASGYKFSTVNGDRMTIDTFGRVTTPSQPHVRVTGYTGVNYSLSAGDNGPLPFNLIQYQIGTNYNNTASNYKFTCPVAGVYQITASVEMSGSTATYTNLQIRINGSIQAGTFQTGYNSAYQQVSTNASIYCNANDYIQLYMNSNITSGNLEFSANDFRNHLTITLLG